MKVLFINSVCGVGSTGRICCELADKLTAEGNECKIAYGRGDVPAEYTKYAYKIGSFIDVYWHVLMTRLFDRHGLASKMSTRKFIKWADDFNPDLLWLHNIHGYYINYEILFDWIKSRPNMQVKWTLHDCWAFTGHCAYYTYINCNKWNKLCYNCPQKRSYPKSLFIDNSINNYIKKKKSFLNVNNLNIVLPSNWLNRELKKSFLSSYSTQVNYNSVDERIFKFKASDLRKKLRLENKIIILGVANIWDQRKGLDDFLELAKIIDERFKIVLIGLSKKQISFLPDNILGIGRTQNIEELMEYYSMADVFVNPTHEDNFPTVNLEAEACGTPVITYDIGGAKETISAPKSIAIEPGVKNLYKCIVDNISKSNKYD